MSAEGRVENQKLNQTAALLSFGWVFGFKLDSLEKHLITLLALIFTVPLLSGDPTAHYTKGKYRESDKVFFKWIELKTKNSTKRQQSCHLVEFLVFNSAFGRRCHLLISSTLSSIGDIGFFLFKIFYFKNGNFIRKLQFFSKSIQFQFYSQVFNFQKVFAQSIFATLLVKKLSPMF